MAQEITSIQQPRGTCGHCGAKMPQFTGLLLPKSALHALAVVIHVVAFFSMLSEGDGRAEAIRRTLEKDDVFQDFSVPPQEKETGVYCLLLFSTSTTDCSEITDRKLRCTRRFAHLAWLSCLPCRNRCNFINVASASALWLALVPVLNVMFVRPLSH
jgi:hypothetical protein